MKKKILSILITAVAIVAILLGNMISYAKYADEPLTVSLSKIQNGVGYGVLNPKNGGEYIWNILPNNTSEKRNLYCVNAEYGQTWFDNDATSTNVTYNYKYDLQSERNALATALANSDVVDADGEIANLIATGGGQYEQLLWLFDNMYIPGKTDKDEFLEKIGILKNEQGNYTESNGYVCNSILTQEDIIAIQKVAIWKFTNGGDFDTLGKNMWLTITTDGETYKNLPTGVSGYKERNEQAVLLYNYLVNSAQANKGNYTAANGYGAGQNKITVDIQGLEATGTNYILQTKIVNGKYITGPIKITAENNNPYEIVLAVTDNNGPIEFDYTDENGTKIQNATIKSLVGRNGGFYISTDISTIDELNISISVTQEKTTKTLWLAGTENKTTGVITLDGEQPIVEVERTKSTETINFVAKPFDLALRKYITAIKSGETVTNLDSRVPNYGDLTALKTGTTGEYKHRKDPVQVNDGDIVTYTIAIYNEGVKAGYASKIIDQLPRGLIASNNLPETVTSKDSEGNVRNTYKIEWDQLTSLTPQNQIILTIADPATAESLQPFTGSELDYETIEIECIVAQKPATDKDTTLTNVAWIAGAYDSEAQKEVSTAGTTDRDSQPQTAPNVNQDIDKTTNYTGNESNKEDLTDSSYYYAGQQDDDDFEKVIIYKEKFDLSLRKFITGINSEELKDDNGNYIREPIVDVTPLNNGETTAIYTHSKKPITVKLGGKIVYTLRVYNEGTINGYATEVKDYLPKYLTFDENSEINKQYGWQKSEDGRVITTTYLADTEIEAFNGTELDYADLKIECIVSESTPLEEKQTNIAEITKYKYNGKDADKDIDSTPDNMIEENWLPEDAELPTYKDEEINNPYIPGNEDDDDFEKIIIKREFLDLSLRKFITGINVEELKDNNGDYIRQPIVDVTPLKNGETTAIYTHSKKPVVVQLGEKIVYTLRVYNEGNINGYAAEIKDYLPKYLTFDENSEINKQYGWQKSEDGRIVTTTYLADTEIQAFNGTELDYADLKIECIVSETIKSNENQTNIAEITKYKYDGKETNKDIDSTADNMIEENWLPEDAELPTYKDEEINNSYIPGNEDDDDFEKIYVQEFDLALKKFITKVQNREITSRVPQVKVENGKISYEHTKDALVVHVGDVVIYTIRIYNEGETSGYASEITDDIPEYLEYLPEDSTNVEYMWKMYDENGNETKNVEEAVKVKTTYLSKENKEEKLIDRFDGTTLDYKDIKIAFKVKNPNSNEYIITNHAQISDDTDSEGNPVNDKDSEPNKWNEGEDDQDIENIKVQYFDLSLLKFVSKVIVIEDGKQKIAETGYNGHEEPEPVVKVELHRKKLNDVIVKFGYGITITNEGDIAGYATEITDYVPEGLKFDPTDNPEWTDEGNNVISTRQLEETLLQPGESKTIEVVFTWINGADNMALKTNTAEISEDKNEYDVPDRDSTPDNKVDGEDDIDIAKVILAVSTGIGRTYFTLALGVLVVVLFGIIIIKKFML